MKALRLQETSLLSFEETLLPQPGINEALIKVSHCAICRTDAKAWRYGQRDLVLPRVLGHEICGTGENTGKRYIVWPGKSCGLCPHCLCGAENLCPDMQILGFHRDGGFAEYAVVPQSSLIPVPESLPGHIACLAELLACGINALDRSHLSSSNSVLIFGGGPAGLLLALAARTKGAQPFILEKNHKKLQRSEDFRKCVGIDAATACAMPRADVAVNAAPSLDAFLQGLTKLNAGGCFCLFSGFSETEPIPVALLNEIHYRQLKVVGAYGCTHGQMQEALTILNGQQNNVALLIEDRITLDHVPYALEEVLTGERLKYVVEF
jgi:D-arabinose 1-dehydrogenase-like Zn-dependent alcohol dehydrogenase